MFLPVGLACSRLIWDIWRIFSSLLVNSTLQSTFLNQGSARGKIATYCEYNVPISVRVCSGFALDRAGVRLGCVHHMSLPRF